MGKYQGVRWLVHMIDVCLNFEKENHQSISNIIVPFYILTRSILRVPEMGI